MWYCIYVRAFGEHYFYLWLLYYLCIISESARNKFKQYVNTLANISQEGGEKYLVLKRKYRVGTHLEETAYPGSSPVTSSSHLPGSPASHLPSPGSSPAHIANPPGQYNVYGSPQHPTPPFNPSSTAIPPPPLPSRATPPYRAPPPYRPPPPATPTHHVYPSGDEVKYGERRYDPPPHPHYNGRQLGSNDPRYPGDLHMHPHPGDTRYPPPTDPRYGYPYEDPADLGIPPPPQVMRSSGSVSSLPGSVGPYSSSHYGTPPPLSASRPKSLSIQQSSVSSLSEDGDSISMSAATTVSTTSTPSSDEPPPPVPPRRRPADNKENLRPSPEGAEVGKKVSALIPL